MKKIVYLSLDERPCNYDFPVKLFDKNDFKIKRIDKSMLGYKKKPAHIEVIKTWLLEQTQDAYGLVISLDTLIYGGILPSRLHHHSKKDLESRIDIIKTIKKNNPKIVIYGFQLIMRCPGYNSSEEEPDYYETYGKNIHQIGFIKHLIELNKADQQQIDRLSEIKVPAKFLDDYIERRHINRQINIATLELVEQQIIDFLVIPQDDSATFGWTAMDQKEIYNVIDEKNLHTKVYMYPGADEVGMTLMARMYNLVKHKRPKLYIKYPSITSPMIIPNIEDRYLDTTVKYQIIVSGGIVVHSLNDADAVVFINAPADKMLSRLSNQEAGRGFIQLRNMPEAIEFIEYACKNLNLPIIIGDVTYGNGSSLEIYNYLKAKQMIFDIAAYGGWNTASNAIGGAIAQGMAYIHDGKTQQLMDFLMLRYVEDIVWDGYVRQSIKNEILPKYSEFNYYDVKEVNGEFSKIAKKEMLSFIEKNMPELANLIKINDVKMPWKRMYEIDIDITYKGKI